MSIERRRFLRAAALLPLAAGLPGRPSPGGQAAADAPPIIDTHQHLWDLARLRLPWLESAPPVLGKSYTPDDYREATRGLNVATAVYMEVDVTPSQHEREADDVVKLARSAETVTRAAVIGGRPASPGFARYLERFKGSPQVKGVRQVLHSAETPKGYCLAPGFVAGVRALGDAGLLFDLCMRPAELDDGLKLTELCPDTRFVVDHCGNADPKAFRKGNSGTGGPSHDPEAWKRAMTGLAKRPNVVCKISGIMAQAPKGWGVEDLAPVVNHCLDSFGPDRVVFGGDWPVCLLGGTYRRWVEALRSIVSNRPKAEQLKLWHDNAEKLYALA